MKKSRPRRKGARAGTRKRAARKTVAKRSSKGAARPSRRRGRRRRRAAGRSVDEVSPKLLEGVLEERLSHSEATPSLSGGDVDADWQRAASSGEEAVGGSVATPDQDVVDEIGRALGVEQPPTAPVVTSDEMLRDRDQRRWELERRADRRKRRG